MRVATSLKAQPAWFRVLKWIVLLAVGVLLWGTPHFWWIVAGGAALGIAIHLLWRWKTKGWTRPWLGWNDLETANDDTSTRSDDA